MRCSDKKIKVLQVVFCWGSGGVERLITNYVNNIENIQMDILVLQTLDDNSIFTDTIKHHDGKIIYLNRRDKSLFRLINRMDFIKKYCNNNCYDIVHVNGGTCIDICYAYAAKRSFTKPVVIMQSHADNVEPPHIAKKKFFHSLFKSLLKNSPDAFMACSRRSYEWMFGYESRNKPSMILKNGIDLSEYKFIPEVRERIRRKYDIEDRFVLGTVGRFSPQKNPFFILDIINNLSKVRSDICLLWVGEGPLFNEIKSKVNDLGLRKNIIFTGAVKDVSKLYQAMDVFILPSVYEGLGIVNIEAQCSGLKCVVSDVVPEEAKITELISFLPINSIAPWVEILSEMNNNYTRRSRIKEAKFCGYDKQDTAACLYKFYKQILS